MDVFRARFIPLLRNAEHVAAALFALFLLKKLSQKGAKHYLMRVVDLFLTKVPFASQALNAKIDKEVGQAVSTLFKKKKESTASVDTERHAIPLKGESRKAILAQMRELKATYDIDPKEGTVFAYVYELGNEHDEFIFEIYKEFMQFNALNPAAFPSLRKFENEAVRMSASLFHGDADCCGTLTSGGTESILMAVKAARDYARAKRGITDPELLIPESAHVAFPKAAHYFGLRVVFAPIDPQSKRVVVSALEALITSRTALIVASAPQYPHGVVDPIAEVGAVAQRHGVLFHVDSCIGGFLLPWVAKLGYPVPAFDFAVPGVTSLSADLHKYAYGPKGSSVVLYRTAELRSFQFFCWTQWCGGIYVSPSALGTRGGGPIAAAWATLIAMGEEGYLAMAKRLMDTATFLKKEIPRVGPFEIIGEPHMAILSFQVVRGSSVNIFAIADIMEDLFGWHMERQPNPDSIHMTLMPPSCDTKERFVLNLAASVAELEKDPKKWQGEGSKAAMYGMVANIPSTAVLDQFCVSLLDKIFH